MRNLPQKACSGTHAFNVLERRIVDAHTHADEGVLELTLVLDKSEQSQYE